MRIYFIFTCRTPETIDSNSVGLWVTSGGPFRGGITAAGAPIARLHGSHCERRAVRLFPQGEPGSSQTGQPR